MKKIINGVRYDTEKATLIGSDSAPSILYNRVLSFCHTSAVFHDIF